jgi:hypothetical protein
MLTFFIEYPPDTPTETVVSPGRGSDQVVKYPPGLIEGVQRAGEEVAKKARAFARLNELTVIQAAFDKTFDKWARLPWNAIKDRRVSALFWVTLDVPPGDSQKSLVALTIEEMKSYADVFSPFLTTTVEVEKK